MSHRSTSDAEPSGAAAVQKTRFFNLDFCRALAIFLIISNHVLTYNYVVLQPTSAFISVFPYELCFALSRLGVPLFLALTGALILSKSFRNGKDILAFYRHNLLPLVIAYLLWSVIFFLFLVWYDPSAIQSSGQVIQTLLFLREPPAPFVQMWYLPMIIGLYLFLPFVALVVQKFRFKDLAIPLTAVLIASFFLPALGWYRNLFAPDADSFNTTLDLSLGAGPYLVYIIFGYYLFRDQILAKLKKWHLYLGLFLGVALAVVFQTLRFYLNPDLYVYWYQFPENLLAGICLFELLRRFQGFRRPGLRRLVAYFSKISLGLFFVHLMVIVTLYRLVPFAQIPSLFLRYLLFYTATISLSTAFVFLLSKLPLARRHLLVIKE